jgi:hypothetical protein
VLIAFAEFHADRAVMAGITDRNSFIVAKQFVALTAPLFRKRVAVAQLKCAENLFAEFWREAWLEAYFCC